MPAAGLRERLAGLALVKDDALPLGATALVIAGLGRPGTRLEDYFRHLDQLAAALAGPADPEPGAAERAARLAEVMAGRHGYRIADEDDPLAEPGLMRVIDDRRGDGSALAVLALEAARRAGWAAEGLAFAPRLLIRLGDGAGGRAIVDPASGWASINAPEMRAILKATKGLEAELAPEHSAALGNRALLLRLQNDAKLRLLRHGDMERALGVVETTLLFAPAEDFLWREAGLMHMRLGRLAPAVAALEQFAARTADPLARGRTLSLLQELRGRIL